MWTPLVLVLFTQLNSLEMNHIVYVNSSSLFTSESEVAQSCLSLCDHMDCSLPGCSVHRIFQARVLEWVAISFSISLVSRILRWASLVAQR